MMTNDLEKFDARLDEFLKKKMSAAEEQAFIAELKANPDLMDRSRVVALAIAQMRELREKQGDRVAQLLFSMSREEFMQKLGESPRLEAFDEKVDRFLKNEMTEDEKTDFLLQIHEIPALKERAQTIALAVKQMHKIRSEADDRVISAIQKDYKPIEHKVSQTVSVSQPSYQYDIGPEIQEKDTGHRVIPIWRKLVRYAAAACVVLAVGIGGFRYYQYSETTSLGEDYAYAIPRASLSRGDDMSNLKDLQLLLDNVRDGKNLTETAERLTKVYHEAIGEDYSDFSPYAYTIGWNAAIAYLKDGNRKEARPILVSIRDRNEGKAIADKASELIKKIDDI